MIVRLKKINNHPIAEVETMHGGSTFDSESEIKVKEEKGFCRDENRFKTSYTVELKSDSTSHNIEFGLDCIVKDLVIGNQKDVIEAYKMIFMHLKGHEPYYYAPDLY